MTKTVSVFRKKMGKTTFLRNEAAAHICTLLLSELKEKITQTRRRCCTLKLCYLSQSFENLATINLHALDISGWSSMRETSFYMKGIIQKTSEKYMFWGRGEDQLWTCFACCLLPRKWADCNTFGLLTRSYKGRLEKFLNLENFFFPQWFFLTLIIRKHTNLSLWLLKMFQFCFLFAKHKSLHGK